MGNTSQSLRKGHDALQAAEKGLNIESSRSSQDNTAASPGDAEKLQRKTSANE